MTLIVTLSLESGLKTISPSLTGSGSSTSPILVASVIATGRVPGGLGQSRRASMTIVPHVVGQRWD